LKEAVEFAALMASAASRKLRCGVRCGDSIVLSNEMDSGIVGIQSEGGEVFRREVLASSWFVFVAHDRRFDAGRFLTLDP
jgi:hypothetical protein